MAEVFDHVVRRKANSRALGVIKDEQLVWLTWTQLADLVGSRMAELAGLGVKRQSRVVQIDSNSLPWIVNDLALQRLGAVHVPLHATLTDQQCQTQIEHCGAKLVLLQTLDDRRELQRTLEGKGVQTVEYSPSPAIVAAAHPVQPSELSADRSSADDLATVLYTSGTTGDPLGVMLSHGNIVANVAATAEVMSHDDDERWLCFLPLSHIYARTCDLYCWIFRGSELVLAESRETVVRDCQIAKPTSLNAVPYFYQKIVDSLRSNDGPVSQGAVRELLGGAITCCFCGGAAASLDTEAFFEDNGLPILPGYGLTEASPVVAATGVGGQEHGTVGKPLGNIDVKLADDGELLVRGPSVMLGYLDNEAATANAVRDGWLHTGDLAAWTDAGNLRIVGRKKEIIVLATGKNIAPTMIENRLTSSPLIEQACVLGDGRSYLSALIVPQTNRLIEMLVGLRSMASKHSAPLKDPRVGEVYQAEIERKLADLADFEQVRKFALLDRGFTLDRGELTPKMSLRRGTIQRHFHREIEEMYSSSPSAAATTQP